jgi:hypothetical protein
VTLAFDGSARKNLAFADWELSIARSEAAEPKRNEAASRRAQQSHLKARRRYA